MAKVTVVIRYDFEAPDARLVSDIILFKKKEGSVTALSENFSIYDYDPTETIISVNGKDVA